MVSGPENDLVHHVFFQDFELRGFTGPEQLPQSWTVAWILDIRVKGIFHKIEKGRQKGKPELLGVLLGAVGDSGHERQNVLRCDGGQRYVSEMVLKTIEDELIVAQRIFF
jgi:hypothetical protein